MKIPKTIYLTYKEKPPSRVLLRWKLLNPHYKIDFSLDKDCIDFLNKYFNSKIAGLFKNIKIGMFKADLWRICKLYIHGGYYADIDLVPLYSLDKIGFKDGTFYSSRGLGDRQIFQAFMATPPKNPLLLAFIMSFLQNKPYEKSYFTENRWIGPTIDMYNTLKKQINNITINKELKFNQVNIPIIIGPSTTSIKNIELLYFPIDIQYKIKLNHNQQNFDIHIENNELIIKSKDNNEWNENLIATIVINSDQKVFLFQERLFNGITNSYICLKNYKIIRSRDEKYWNARINNKKWV